MDIFVPGMRDRRDAAADVATNRRGFQIFAPGTRPRLVSERSHGVGFDVRRQPFNRTAGQITTVVLHQTTFSSDQRLPSEAQDSVIDDEHRLDFVLAHFVIRTSGEIIYLRDIEYRLSSVSGRFGIDIEFEGSYSVTPAPSGQRLSRESIQAGRRLLLWLQGYVPSIGHIHPHGQLQRSGGKRHTCSGPDIWVNVGRWADNTLGWSSETTARGYANLGISDRQDNSAYDQHVDG